MELNPHFVEEYYFSLNFRDLTHIDLFSESCYFKPNLNCYYNFPIDLAPNGIPFAVLNLSENGNCNPNLVWIKKISKIFLCVYQSIDIQPMK